jgi:putative chitinase
MIFNRKIFFDEVRHTLFNGSLSQQQVDGLNFKLDQWEETPYHPTDLRWLANPLAQSYHETGATMWPIEEYGKGSGYEYGVQDPDTGQTYYGRGDMQLTWRENYARAARELLLAGTANDLEYHAEKALDPLISASVMYKGMSDGWFRSDDQGPQTLGRYFSETVDDPYGAREIVNGDKKTVPGWSNGVSIGNLIATYHSKFLTALEASVRAAFATGEAVLAGPRPSEQEAIMITVPKGQRLFVNGVEIAL